MALKALTTKPFGPTDATTTIAAVWTPGAGLVPRAMGVTIGASAAGVVHITDGTAAAAGTVATVQVPANASVYVALGEGRRASAADMPLGIKAESGTVSNVAATFVGREEPF